MRRRIGVVAIALGLVVAFASCGARLQAATQTPAVRGAPPPAAKTPAASPRRIAVPRPAIRRWYIPIGDRRRHETAAYGARHYGRSGWKIAHPNVIVEHLTENGSIAATYNTFAPDVPDIELHELPGLCSQFAIGPDGAIVQFTPVRFMCRHTVGLNWTAIGIEHVGYREQDVLGRVVQLDASLRLTRWLRCRFHIPVRDVIGHAESLSSPYHHEQVASLRTQTHADWQPWAMRQYRAKLRARGDCTSATATAVD
jgi:beta-N-acetylhexosaminidase